MCSTLLEWMMGPLYDDMRGMEQLLAASDLEWTIFRPPRLLNRPGTGHFRCAVGRPIPGGWALPRADLATAMLAAIDDHTLIRQAVTIAT
ncbi:MAG: NAD(P)-dependent oxidoreductase [Pseudonocardiaceae bacterium]